jgi:hypothetical protein
MSHEPTPERSEPQRSLEAFHETIRRVAAVIADGPAMQGVRRHIAEYQAAQAQQLTGISEAINRREQERAARFSQQIAQAVLPGIEQRRALINQAMDAYGRSVREYVARQGQLSYSFDTTGLERMLAALDANRIVAAETRQRTARLLADAYDAADTGTATDDDVSEDLVAELEEAARDFAARQGGGLSPKAQRSAFIWFWGIIIFLSLMQAAFTNDAVKEIIDESACLAPYAGVAMMAAGKAWDRCSGQPESGDDPETS